MKKERSIGCKPAALKRMCVEWGLNISFKIFRVPNLGNLGPDMKN